MGDGEAVADEQDDILGLAAAGGVEHLPGDGRLAVTGCCFDIVAARLGDHGVMDPIGRMAVAILALFEIHRLAEHFGGILAVDGDLCRSGCGGAGELDLQIEFGACKNFRSVDREDGLRGGGQGEA